ncbi:hypothetical protein NMY22_g2388 [Coprinellus aureogranulatus]|nr:hypothetical protein NMY22_g2388 [Coprinellus aureogranulatus]
MAPTLRPKKRRRLTSLAQGDVVFHCLELALIYLEMVDWDDLVNYAHTSVFGREAAHAEMTRRIREALAPWFPTKDLADGFMNMLYEFDAVVVGRVVRDLLESNAEDWYAATPVPMHGGNLNVVTKPFHFGTVLHWLQRYTGYKFGLVTRIPNAFENTVMLRMVVRRTVEDNGHAPTITISQSNGNIINTVLSAPFSTQTYMMTGSAIFDFFPTLTAIRGAIMNGRWEFDVSGPPPGALLPRKGNHNYTRPCGWRCPASKRNQYKHERARITLLRDGPIWNVERVEEIREDAWNSTALTRYALRCENSKCPNQFIGLYHL